MSQNLDTLHASSAASSAKATTLVHAVRTHAYEYYQHGCWSYVIEAWDDADIVAAIGKARTAAGAIRAVGRLLHPAGRP